jgi:hypothetical protein
MNQSAPADLVRMQRMDDLEALVCRVHLSTDECVVASELSDSLDLDGLCIIPTKTVRCFDRAFERVDFYKAALEAWPEVSPHAARLGDISCSLIQDLSLLAQRGDTVAIHMELDDPDICHVGTIQGVTETEFVLNRISSRGRSIDEPLHVALDSITKIAGPWYQVLPFARCLTGYAPT